MVATVLKNKQRSAQGTLVSELCDLYRVTEPAVSTLGPLFWNGKTTVPRVPFAVARSNHRTLANRGCSLRKNWFTAVSYGDGLLCCAPGQSQLRGCPDQEGVSGRNRSLAPAEAAPPWCQPNRFPVKLRAGKGHLFPLAYHILALSWSGRRMEIQTHL